MFKKRILIAFALFLISNVAFGQNKLSPMASKILKELKIPISKVNLNLYSEKEMPASPENSIYFLPLYSETGEEKFNKDNFKMDANIIVANNTKGKIIAKYQKANAYFSDAITLESVEIDNDLFVLNAETRAFGIRINYTGKSTAKPFRSTELTIFVIKNEQIIDVLTDYLISRWRGEWDSNCSGKFENFDSVISIEEEKTNDYHNIALKVNKTYITNYKKGDECESKETKITTTTILKFSGEEYF